jgi:hypothetical protein|tara:strand:- start:202 stop:507 length:306 start_codon:yes stop_codon:yes gene_type:complete
MNQKIIKRINRQIPLILTGWLKTLVDVEEHHKIEENNIDKYLPELQYISIKGTYVLGQFSKRWTNRIVKKMVKAGHIVEDIDYDYFTKYYKDYMHVSQAKG